VIVSYIIEPPYLHAHMVSPATASAGGLARHRRARLPQRHSPQAQAKRAPQPSLAQRFT
jgi:hypothetical protein